MTCDHCAGSVATELNAFRGVSAQVSFEHGMASVDAPADVST